METSQVEFSFPVLGFTPDREFWGFPDRNSLTSCGPQTLRDNKQAGMELIDADGRRWVVRSIRRTGRAKSPIRWLVSVFLSTPQSRIEQELEALEPVSLAEIRERCRASLEAFPQDYCLDDEREEVFEPLLDRVTSAQSVAEIYELLGLDTFEAY